MSLQKIMSSKSSAWGFGDQSTITLGDDEENYKCTPLRLIQRKSVVNPKRPQVGATLLQRAVFYQYQVNSPSKSQVHGTKPHLIANWMLVAMSANLALGALGTYYVQVFLGVFATEQHLCVSKMVPFAMGINIIYFYSAILDLSRSVDLSIAFLDYFLFGIINRAPWNRCNAFNVTVPASVLNGTLVEYKCLELEAFRDLLIANASSYRELAFGKYTCYKFKAIDYCLQLPQITYLEYRNNYLKTSKLVLAAYFIFLWGGCLLAQKQIYRKIIWKILFYANIALCGIYFIASVHVIAFPELTPHAFSPDDEIEEYKDPTWELIQLMSACFVFSPPMIHFLSARCKNISPSQESFVMTFTTVVHTMFYIFANFLVYDYAIHRMGGLDIESLFISTVSYMNIFYWFIYFGTMDAGNFFCLTFLIVNFIMEYTSLIISFNCFVEIYSSEYRWTKRWFVIILISVISFVNYGILSEERYIIQFIIRIIIMIMETLIIHGIYSLRRLMDDIFFFYGQEPSKMRHFTVLISVIIEFLISSQFRNAFKRKSMRRKSQHDTLLRLTPNAHIPDS